MDGAHNGPASVHLPTPSTISSATDRMAHLGCKHSAKQPAIPVAIMVSRTYDVADSAHHNGSSTSVQPCTHSSM